MLNLGQAGSSGDCAPHGQPPSLFHVKAKGIQALIVTGELREIDLGSPPKAKAAAMASTFAGSSSLSMVPPPIPIQAGVGPMEESLLEIELAELMDAIPSFMESQEENGSDWGASSLHLFAKHAIIDVTIFSEKGKASREATFTCTWDKDRAQHQACIPDHAASLNNALQVG